MTAEVLTVDVGAASGGVGEARPVNGTLHPSNEENPMPIDPKLKAYWTACKKATDSLWTLRARMEELYPPGTVLQSGGVSFLGWTADLTGAVIDAHLCDVNGEQRLDRREPGVQVILEKESGDYESRVCKLTYQQLLSRDEGEE